MHFSAQKARLRSILPECLITPGDTPSVILQGSRKIPGAVSSVLPGASCSPSIASWAQGFVSTCGDRPHLGQVSPGRVNTSTPPFSLHLFLGSPGEGWQPNPARKLLSHGRQAGILTGTSPPRWLDLWIRLTAPARCWELGYRPGKGDPSSGRSQCCRWLPRFLLGEKKVESNFTIAVSVICIAVPLPKHLGGTFTGKRHRVQMLLKELKGRGDFFLSDSVVSHR